MQTVMVKGNVKRQSSSWTHRRAIGIGAQSTLRGHKIFAQNMYKKSAKCPNFTWFLPEKLSKNPIIYDICPKIYKIPEFYIIIAENIFLERPPVLPTVSHAYAQSYGTSLANFPYMITQCYLPPDTGVPPTPARQAGTRCNPPQWSI